MKTIAKELTKMLKEYDATKDPDMLADIKKITGSSLFENGQPTREFALYLYQ